MPTKAMSVTSFCKYCDTAIVWSDRKPFNADETPHDFACCKAIRRENKLAWSRHAAEHHRREATAIIRENARMVAERGFKQPNNLHARRNQPIVTQLLDGTAKVAWHVVYVGVLANSHPCKVRFHKGGNLTNSSCTVEPFSRRKKDIAAFEEAVAQVNQ